MQLFKMKEILPILLKFCKKILTFFAKLVNAALQMDVNDLFCGIK